MQFKKGTELMATMYSEWMTLDEICMWDANEAFEDEVAAKNGTE